MTDNMRGRFTVRSAMGPISHPFDPSVSVRRSPVSVPGVPATRPPSPTARRVLGGWHLGARWHWRVGTQTSLHDRALSKGLPAQGFAKRLRLPRRLVLRLHCDPAC